MVTHIQLRKAVALILASAVSGAAIAATPSDPAGVRASGVEEVLVTARRREESIQEVPVAVANIGAEELEARGINSLENLSATVPNVNLIGGLTGSTGGKFSMRGIPGVATYVDGIWQQQAIGLLQGGMVDLERIEVLRGPQGTLFGRDAIGGAIRIWTRRPADTFGGTATMTVGSYGRMDVGGSVDVPITDSFRTKFTAVSQERTKGYVSSTKVDRAYGANDDTYLRGDIAWDITDRLDARFVVDRSHLTHNGQPKVQDAIFVVPGQSGFRVNGEDLGINLIQVYNAAGIPVTNETQVAGYPSGQVGEWQNTSTFTGEGAEFNHTQYSLEVNYRLNDAFAVQLLSGYVDTDDTQHIEFDGLNVHMLEYRQYNKTSTFSQELQISGNAGRFNWVGGGFYWDNSVYARRYEYYMYEFANFPQNAANRAVVTDLCTNRFGNTPAAATCFNSILRPAQDLLTWAGQHGWAAFGEVSMDVTDRFKATLGMRYHDQTNEATRLTFDPNVAAKPLIPGDYPSTGNVFAGTFGPVTQAEFSKNTMRAALNYQWNPDLMTYVSYSEGFTSGGRSTPVASVNPNPPFNTVVFDRAFEPETVGNYELGMRSDWLNGTLRVNATAFFMDYENVQILSTLVDPFGRVLTNLATQNLADGEAKGVEVEVTAAPTDDWLITANVGYLDTKYTKVAPGAVYLRLDSDFGQAPEYTASVGVQRAFDLGFGDLTSRIDYSYVSDFKRDRAPEFQMSYWDPTVKSEAGDYGLLNARLSYTRPGAPWEVALAGTNLTNENYVNSGFFATIWGLNFATLGRPREYSATLKFNF